MGRRQNRWLIVAALLAACGGAPSGLDGGDDADTDAAAIDASRVDAAMRDAATTDASTTDSGIDATSSPDVGAIDAGNGGVGYAGTSFRATTGLTYAAGAPTTLPTTLVSTLWTAERSDGARDAVWSTDLVFADVVTRNPDGTWPARWVWQGAPGCGHVARVDVTFALTFLDDDGGGLADRFVGSGSGELRYYPSDFMESTVALDATVIGLVEHDAPTLSVASALAGHVPITGSDATSLALSEPVTAPADAWLEAPDGHRVPLRAFGSGDAPPSLVIGWQLYPPETLPLDVDLVFRFTGTLADLDGHTLATPPALSTLPIPAPVAVEDLETGTTVHLEGAATLESALGSLPALDGARSALLAPPDVADRGGSSLVARISVPAGASAVHVRARYLAMRAPSPVWSWGALPPVRVYSLAGDSTTTSTGPAATMHIATGDATWRDASEVVDLVLPLPATTTSEVVVRVGEVYDACGQLPSSGGGDGLWIDDIRAE